MRHASTGTWALSPGDQVVVIARLFCPSPPPPPPPSPPSPFPTPARPTQGSGACAWVFSPVAASRGSRSSVSELRFSGALLANRSARGAEESP